MRKIFTSILGFFLFLFFWGALAHYVSAARSTIHFPGPLDVFLRLGQYLKGENIYGFSLYKHIGSSLGLWIEGLILGVVTGLVLGIITGRFETLRTLFLPLFSILQVIPGMAWIPVALLLFGIGRESTIFMITISALPPVFFNVQAAVRDIPPIYTRVAGMMELKFSSQILHIFLPAVSPGFITGIRLGFAAAWRVLIAAEMVVGSNLGLGYSILQARWTLDFTSAFVFVTIIATIGLVFEKGLFEPFDRKIRLRRGLSG